MMDYIAMISYFLTNEMRLLLGLLFITKVMNFLPKKRILLLSAAGGVLITALQIAGLSTIGFLTVESGYMVLPTGQAEPLSVPDFLL